MAHRQHPSLADLASECLSGYSLNGTDFSGDVSLRNLTHCVHLGAPGIFSGLGFPAISDSIEKNFSRITLQSSVDTAKCFPNHTTG